MDIKPRTISVKSLVRGYVNNAEEGVVGYGGKLDIRPKYQREFIYDGKRREAVINTIFHDFPLNSIYWAVTGDGTYEVLDGQQRIMSICEYHDWVFSYQNRYFHNLTPEEQDQFLNYKLTVHFCKGNDKEKLDWFRVINIAGVILSDQELRNAVYAGPWVSDAKGYFSRTGCPAHRVAGDYMKEKANRQDYLEAAIQWASEDGNIEKHMGKRQNKKSAKPLFDRFKRVIDWVRKTFPEYNSEMKKVGRNWGRLYDEHKDKPLKPDTLKRKVSKLMADDEVTNKKGIYEYVLSGQERHLNLRLFSGRQKSTAYAKQGKKCKKCGKRKAIGEMQADHIIPWARGGKTSDDNIQMLCIPCHQGKGVS